MLNWQTLLEFFSDLAGSQCPEGESLAWQEAKVDAHHH